MNQGRPDPLHRTNEDIRIRYQAWKSKALANDGRIDDLEQHAGLQLIEQELFPNCEELCELNEFVVSAMSSPRGIRGHRPERLRRNAEARAKDEVDDQSIVLVAM